MNTLSKILASTLVLFAVALQSCKKETVDDGPDIIFKTSVDAYTVTFTNQTEGATAYSWDFGDGATSTEKSPVHTYPGKGKYVPTLTVTVTGGQTYEGSTIVRISKSSAVKLDDASFSDWDTVVTNVRQSGTGGGIFRLVKLDYDAENVYFYIEMKSTEAAGDIFDFYVDADNNSTTGLTTWVSTGTGNDVLLEGAMLTGWFDMFYHKGAQNSFSFDAQTTTDFYQVGTKQQVGDLLKFEGKLVRSKIKFLTGKGVKLAATATKNDWSEMLGVLPDPGTPALYLDMSE